MLSFKPFAKSAMNARLDPVSFWIILLRYPPSHPIHPFIFRTFSADRRAGNKMKSE